MINNGKNVGFLIDKSGHPNEPSSGTAGQGQPASANEPDNAIAS